MDTFSLDKGLSPEAFLEHLCEAAFQELIHDGFRLTKFQKEHLRRALRQILNHDLCISQETSSGDRSSPQIQVTLGACKSYDWDLISNLYDWGLISSLEAAENLERQDSESVC